MAISKKAWTGNARETTPGTGITTPSRYIPTKTVFKGGKKREYLNEERGDRNGNYGVVDSVRQSSIQMKGPWYNDVSPTLLWAGMGLPNSSQPNATGAPNVWQHAFQLQDVPPSYTTHRNLDAIAYYIPYSILEKWVLSFTADGKLLEVEGDYLGLFAQPLTSPPSPTYSTLNPFAGYAPTIKFIDNVVSNDVSDMQIEYSQKCTLWYPANGTQDFVTVYFGERTMKVDFTARFDNTTIYNRWRQNVNDSLTFDVQGPVIGKYIVLTEGGSAGTFTITYGANTTAAIAFGANASAIQSALQAIIPPGTNVTVTGTGPFTLVFAGTTLNDGITPTVQNTGGATASLGTLNTLNQELNVVLPTISYDTVEHDLGKDNVLIKAKATVIVPPGTSLITGFVQNTITGTIMSS